MRLQSRNAAASLVVEEEAVYSHDAKDTVYTDAHRHTQFAYHGMASQMPVAVYIHILFNVAANNGVQR